MDPNATLSAIAIALNNEDHADADELVEHLRAWLAAGGFEPEWTAYPRARLYCVRRRLLAH